MDKKQDFVWTLIFVFGGILPDFNIVEGATQNFCFSSKQGAPPTVVDLSCDPGKTLFIQEAFFGRNRWEECYYTINDCGQSSDALEEECCSKNQCTLEIEKTYIPACGFSSFLRVIYECVSAKNFTCGTSATLPSEDNSGAGDSKPPSSGQNSINDKTSGKGADVTENASTPLPLDWQIPTGQTAPPRVYELAERRPDEQSGNGDQTAVIIGGSVGASVLFLLCVALAGFLLWRRHQDIKEAKERKQTENDVREMKDLGPRNSPEGGSHNMKEKNSTALTEIKIESSKQKDLEIQSDFSKGMSPDRRSSGISIGDDTSPDTTRESPPFPDENGGSLNGYVSDDICYDLDSDDQTNESHRNETKRDSSFGTSELKDSEADARVVAFSQNTREIKTSRKRRGSQTSIASNTEATETYA
ncbi:unnamed protein product [Owenia fusiformis]|uniref:Uncharacterized protein n=1 Tax=Owenia fusiformis TaxID=6347 RepID=A0A8J1TCX5_OWEFU|nr:unnamed protein product [Owenia fusiformis]